MSIIKSDTNNEVADRIKSVRKSKHLSQAKFAESLGIKQPTLSEIENGAYLPSDSVIRLIVHQYNISGEWLQSGKGEMFRKDAEGESGGEAAQTSLGEGLRYYRNMIGLTQSDIANILGITSDQVVEIEEGIREPSSEVKDRFVSLLAHGSAGLKKISKKAARDVLEGFQLFEGAKKTEPSTGMSEAALLPLDPKDVVVMQVYITGGAGAPHEFIPTEPIEEIILPKSFYSHSIVPVKVQGRSMEKTLRDGAIVGVDRADRQIVNGELYAVWLPYQGTVIKRLYIDKKRILLQSDNEEFRAQDIEVALGEVDEHFIQGRVKWVIQVL